MTSTQYDQRAATVWFKMDDDQCDALEMQAAGCLDAPDYLTGSTHAASWEGGDSYASMTYFDR